MTSNQIISFTSDFGNSDGYVGIVKGAMLSVNCNAKIVDISHDVQPFNIRSAAWIIYNGFNYFPPDSVHLVVVDPGVGSHQRRILVQSGKYSFVGPDNGVFSLIVQDPLGKRAANERLEAYDLLENPELRTEQLSSTFHARDIFGPVAARLSLGHQAKLLGQPIEINSLVELNGLKLEQTEELLNGRVIHIDHFGNLITNIPASLLSAAAVITVNDVKVGSIARTYHSVDKGQLTAISASHGFLEIAVSEGRAVDALKASIGSRVLTDQKAPSSRAP
ncbi:MAG: SAM-dependent chlorinase/fluorinase [Candidatus Obscuribacterales bacterium]|nr:SAM-dependent chlorinase/fluorinase [Candidatus Obscuribacterales bacterium]